MLWSLSQKQQGTTEEFDMRWRCFTWSNLIYGKIILAAELPWAPCHPSSPHKPGWELAITLLMVKTAIKWLKSQPCVYWLLASVHNELSTPLGGVAGCCWVDLLRRGGGRGGCEGWIWGSTFCSHVHLYWCPCCHDDVLEFNKPHYSFPRNGRSSMGGEVGPSPSMKREAVHSSSNESFY